MTSEHIRQVRDNVGSPYPAPPLPVRLYAKAFREFGALRDAWLPHPSAASVGARVRAAAAHHAPRILVLCQGNICRSPVAAMLLQQAVADTGAVVMSAGLGPAGRTSPPAAIDTATHVGIDLRAHRARNVHELDSAPWDVLIGMESSHVWRARAALGVRASGAVGVLLGTFAPDARTGVVIPDPEGHTRDTFLLCYQQIAAAVAELAPWIAVTDRA